MYKLGGSDVHIWVIHLAATPETRRTYQQFLSLEETARAARFAFDHLREAYELSQGALRLLLSKYLQRPPEEFAFELGVKGKPALRDHPSLGFNKSHTNGMAMYAFAADREVGVDVEKLREIPYSTEIAERFFAPQEADQPFLPLWTRKEAYVKALGTGLFSPLNEPLPADWTVQQLDPAPGYTAAVAYPGPKKAVHLRRVMSCDDLLR